MKIFKIYIWLLFTILGLVINVLTTLAVAFITFKVGTSFQNLVVLLWLMLGSIVAIVNSFGAAYYYDKARYNQDFVDIVTTSLRVNKQPVNAMDSSNVTDDSTNDSDNQNPSVDR